MHWEVSGVAARTATRTGQSEADTATRKLALMLWLAALLLLTVGTFLVTRWVGRGDGGWFPEILLLAVPAGLMLGGAISVTLRASGRRAHAFGVSVGALVVAMAVYAIAGAVSWWNFAQSGVCSPSQKEQYQALTFYDDLVQPPAGKAGEGSGVGSCYASYVIDQPRQQAWATMNGLLAQNGWDEISRGRGEVNARFRKDSVLMIVWDSGEFVPHTMWAEPPTTFYFNIQTSP
jgi:hypothetical protein